MPERRRVSALRYEGAGAPKVVALGQEVPEELWPAVAEVLAWAYGLEREAITPNR